MAFLPYWFSPIDVINGKNAITPDFSELQWSAGIKLLNNRISVSTFGNIDTNKEGVGVTYGEGSIWLNLGECIDNKDNRRYAIGFNLGLLRDKGNKFMPDLKGRMHFLYKIK